MDEITVLLVLAGAAWVMFRWWRSGARAGANLAQQADDMEETAEQFMQLSEELKSVVQREDYPAAIRIAEQAVALVDERMNGNPEFLLPSLGALANFHELAGQPEQGMAALQRNLALRDKFPALNTEPAEQAELMAQLCALHLRRGETSAAQNLSKREVALRRKHVEGDDAALLQAQCRLLALSLETPDMAEAVRRDIRTTAGQVSRDVLAEQMNEAYATFRTAHAEGRNREAWAAAETCALLAPALHGPQQEATLTLQSNLAEMLRRNRRHEEADTQFRQVIAQMEKPGADQSGLESVYNNMALLCDESGRPDEAAQWRKRQMTRLQDADVSVGSRFNGLNNLGVSLSNQGNEQAAADTFAQALALSPEGDGVEPAIWASALSNYGGTLVTLKRFSEAGRQYKTVLEKKKAGMDIPMHIVAGSLNGLGIVFDRLGNLQQAQEMFERAMGIKEKLFAAGDKALETGWANLGSVHFRLGDFARAVDMAKRVLASRETRLGKDHPSTENARQNLGSAQAALKIQTPATREEVDALMVKVTGGELHRHATYSFGSARNADASAVLVPEPDSVRLQHALSRSLPSGWYGYIGNTRWHGIEKKHEGKAELVAIPTHSQFDCLRVAGTDATNHDMQTEDLIRVLEGYHHRFGIRIVGADSDSVDFVLLRQPEDLNAFAAELLEFCMDLEDVSLILPMLTSPNRMVSLWWD